MKQTKIIMIMVMIMLLCASIVSATITYTINAPAALAETTSTSMTFNWNATSDDLTQPSNMTTWVYLSAVNSETPVENTTASILNTTWGNATTITGLSVGFYKWYLKTNDSDGNTTSLSNYFEVRDTDNYTDFRWENDTGFRAMTLNKDTGDLDVTRNVEIGGNLTVLGDLVTLNITTLDINGSILPALDDTFDLGSVLLTWDNLFVNTITFGNASAAILDSPTQSYLRVGDASTSSRGLIANDDLFVSGKLEVDGTSAFDAGVVFYASLATTTNVPIYMGSANDAILYYTTSQSPSSLFMGVGQANRGVIIAEEDDKSTDFAQPLKTNPTVFIQSANATDGDEFMSLEHDQTDARAVSGQGDYRLSAADNINIDANITMGDDTNYLLFEERVNGTYAVLQSYQDLDIYISPSGNNVRLPTATNVTWDNGAHIWVNSTCIVLTSPAGSGVYSVCD